MRRVIVKFMLASLVAVAVAAWVTVTPHPAKAAFPGQNGRIVFMKQDAAEHWQTWVANKDLSNQDKLTSGPASNGWAVWKPGGAKLLYEKLETIHGIHPHKRDGNRGFTGLRLKTLYGAE